VQTPIRKTVKQSVKSGRGKREIKVIAELRKKGKLTLSLFLSLYLDGPNGRPIQVPQVLLNLKLLT